MLSMIARRLIVAVPSLIGVIIVTFLLTRALPGDPAAYFAGPAATQQAIERRHPRRNRSALVDTVLGMVSAIGIALAGSSRPLVPTLRLELGLAPVEALPCSGMPFLRFFH